MHRYLIAVSFCLVSAANAKDIVDTAVSAGNFNTLAAALQAADLVDTRIRSAYASLPETAVSPTFAQTDQSDR